MKLKWIPCPLGCWRKQRSVEKMWEHLLHFHGIKLSGLDEEYFISCRVCGERYYPGDQMTMIGYHRRTLFHEVWGTNIGLQILLAHYGLHHRDVVEALMLMELREL